MKPKQSSPGKDELGKIDFVPTTKPKEANLTIGHESSKVKLGVNDLMTLVFHSMNKGLPKLAKLQREAREGRDG